MSTCAKQKIKGAFRAYSIVFRLFLISSEHTVVSKCHNSFLTLSLESEAIYLSFQGVVSEKMDK